ncbi:MAG: RdgB/HAM1 family non-canonical purine NTP pyrophosphatase [Muribaculaceae bacterium]|nr:RdgB/HAM1 family non-canonical purine NTP pyrophosphatase [Muribaculaceae bacterium]
MKRIVFATGNSNKLRELREILGADYEVCGLRDIGCDDDIPETADTFEGNALLKAQWVRDRYGVDCIAEDAGLEVDALGGAPGVLSARFAGPGHDSRANNELLLRRLEGVADRRARFRTSLVLLRADGPHFFEGKIEGDILEAPRGEGGFGYDPLFVPKGWTKTFAEAGAEEKNAVSHRGQAVAALQRFIESENKSR